MKWTFSAATTRAVRCPEGDIMSLDYDDWSRTQQKYREK